MRDENHIIDREATAEKIRTLLTNIHKDRNSKFDSFTFRGKKLSAYTNHEWIEQVAHVIEAEIYNEAGPNMMWLVFDIQESPEIVEPVNIGQRPR